MKRWVLILIHLTGSAIAQNVNLVPNYSFEDTIKCQLSNGFQFINNWYSPNTGSPDAYHICTDNFVPSAIDSHKRHSGYGRVGIIVYDSINHVDGSEYIANEFIEKLQNGKQYCLSLYVIPAKGFRFSIDRLGIFFGLNTQYYSSALIPVSPQLVSPSSVFIDDTSTWYNYNAIYSAIGGESDFVIGNFNPFFSVNQKVIDTSFNAAKMAYLIIDDVSLREMSLDAGDDAVTCPGNMVTTIGEINADTAFKNYYWYDAAGALIDSINSQIQVQPSSNTFYVQEKRMCGQHMYDTVYVNVQGECPIPPPEPEAPLMIPNVFSPNSDGINDSWKVEVPHSYTLNSIELYNRWGIKVATTSDLTSMQTDKVKVIQWFGRTTSGVACSEGVYYYTLELKNSKNIVEKYQGYVSLFK